jgi:hypothetical protein|tara:strand:+ start:190 stop:504 length:315 start_codon:yes stop_codon:yes gene_type:complete
MEQCKKMVDFWWDLQNIKRDEDLFREGGKFYDEKKDGLINCWLFQIRNFLNSTFEYKNDKGIIINFKIKDLDKVKKRLLIKELGNGIGVNNFLYIYDKYLSFLS